jgi:hypothetical protein
MALYNSANVSQPTGAQVVEAATMLGVTPDSLACVGINGADVRAVLDRLAEDFEDYQSYSGLLRDAAAAHDRMVTARASARLDPHDPTAVAELQSAETAMQAAQSRGVAARADLIAALTESLCDLQDVACTYTGPHFLRLPPAYRQAELNETGARTLAWALSLRARLGGEDLPTAAANAISAAESQYRVQLALTRLRQDGAANQTAMQNWVTEN